MAFKTEDDLETIGNPATSSPCPHTQAEWGELCYNFKHLLYRAIGVGLIKIIKSYAEDEYLKLIKSIKE